MQSLVNIFWCFFDVNINQWRIEVGIDDICGKGEKCIFPNCTQIHFVGSHDYCLVKGGSKQQQIFNVVVDAWYKCYVSKYTKLNVF